VDATLSDTIICIMNMRMSITSTLLTRARCRAALPIARRERATRHGVLRLHNVDGGYGGNGLLFTMATHTCLNMIL
jgi:hypothetical protein